MSVVAQRLGRLESENLRKRTPNDLALEILDLLKEKNLLVWYNPLRYGTKIGFVSLTDGESKEELNSLKSLKSENALIALFKREYIEQVGHIQAVNSVNDVRKKAKTSLYATDIVRRGFARTTGKLAPWADSYNSEVFQITETGVRDLPGFKGKIKNIRAQEQALVVKPRFVASTRTDVNGYPIEGVNKVYRIVKETVAKTYVRKVEPTDGFPEMDWYDRGFKTESKAYGQNGSEAVYFLERANVALTDITVEQFALLQQATVEYDQSINQALQVKNQAILPIDAAYARAQKEAFNKLKQTIVGFKETKKSSLVTNPSKIDEFVLDVDDSFLLGLDEESNGFKP